MRKYIQVKYPDGQVEYWAGFNFKEYCRLQKIYNYKIKLEIVEGC